MVREGASIIAVIGYTFKICSNHLLPLELFSIAEPSGYVLIMSIPAIGMYDGNRERVGPARLKMSYCAMDGGMVGHYSFQIRA